MFIYFRVYIEKDDDQTLRLYIQTIENDDAATYICKGEIEGNIKQDSITLELYRKLFNAPPLLLAARYLYMSIYYISNVFIFRGYHIY